LKKHIIIEIVLGVLLLGALVYIVVSANTSNGNIIESTATPIVNQNVIPTTAAPISTDDGSSALLKEGASIQTFLLNHYVNEFYNSGATLDSCGFDIKNIVVKDGNFNIDYDFYETAEGWSLKVGTVVLAQNNDGSYTVVSDTVDATAMAEVQKEQQAAAGN